MNDGQEKQQNEERRHWLFAGLHALIPLEVCVVQFGLRVAVFFALTILIAWSLSEWTRNRERAVPAAGPTVERLIFLVDEFCKQRNARRLQLPWLAVSLASYTTAYLVWAFENATETPTFWHLVAVLSVACAGMARAGILAEDHRPFDGKDALFEFLASYPAQDEAALVSLREKIFEDDWTLPEFVTFATREEETRNLRLRQAESARMLGESCRS